MPSRFWADARAQMLLDADVINLNTGSFGPLPRVVFDQVTRLRHRLAEEPMDFLVRQTPPLLWQARERLAHYLAGDPYRLAFTANVTAAINTVAASLRLAAPGEILLTDHEYGAMHWCWERAAQRQGLTLRTFRLPILAETPEEIVSAARTTFTDKTRLLFFSHVLSPTGLVLPARELCAEARGHGIVSAIDGAHAPGMIPLNLEEIASDYYGGNCHKWILAPTGSGFLYFAPGSEERLQPLQVSWGWHHDRKRVDQRDEFGATPRLRYYESEGVRDPCPWLAVPTALDFQIGLGPEGIHARIEKLVRYVRERLSTIKGMSLATPTHPALHGAMTAFRLPAGLDPVALRRTLWEQYHIEAPIIERPEGLLIRVSTHFYNTEQEIDRLGEALEMMSREW
ncbi:MAG TPA: aminotransferase class V-fold PLP-dependent enzyme [Gemmataceae bacterium]|nr:aminotransferase class V-fold PLP-dependent enzyme [Gemmataceae bacterium]